MTHEFSHTPSCFNHALPAMCVCRNHALNKTPYNPKQLFWQRSDSTVIDGPDSCVFYACSELVGKRRERASERGEEKKDREGESERERD